MSYILDALKKSDRERRSREGPTIQTIHRPIRHSDATTLVITVALVIMVMVTGVLALFWFQQNRGVSARIKTPQAVVLSTSEQGAQAASPVSDAESGNRPTVAFSELPDPVRAELPALTFSFHVYSEKPQNRTIIINKRRVREGDQVIPGLQLHEITPEGVVLQWRGHPFYINVVENW